MDRPHIIRRIATLFLLIYLACLRLDAQPWDPNWFTCDNVGVTNCNSAVPSLFVDMRSDPDYTWYSCLINRGSNIDTCCGFPQSDNNDRCIEFKVLMHPNAVAILFEIPDASDPLWQIDRNHPAAPGSPGAKPNGSLEYRLNCSATTYLPDVVACVTQAQINDTIFITFCKPGANANVYRIRSIMGEIDAGTLLIQQGECGGDVSVTGTNIDYSTLTWNSIQHPSYNSFLSSPNGQTVTVTVPNGDPLTFARYVAGVPYLDYEVCGYPIGHAQCSGLPQVCAIASVAIVQPPSITVQDVNVCPGPPYFVSVSHPNPNLFRYWWYNGPNGTGTLVASGNGVSSYNFPTPGTKSVVFIDPTVAALGLDPNCTRDTINFNINLFPVPPAQINGPTDFCPNVNYNYTAVSAGTGAFYQWNFGSGAIPATHSGLNNPGRIPPPVRWTTCGNKTITLTVTSADGCDSTTTFTVFSDTQNPVINCPATATIECDQTPTPALTGTATATDNCGVAITYSDVIVPGPCPGEYTIQRTWRATDPCGNFSTCVQLINVVDTEPPVLTCNVTNLILECDQNYAAEINTWRTNMRNLLLAGASDNCGTVSVSDNYAGGLPTISCTANTGLVVTFTVSDDCGNSTNCTASIIIDDTQPPVVNCVVNDLIMECGDNYSALINAWLTASLTTLQSNTTDACGVPPVVTHDYDGSSVPTLNCTGTTGLTITFYITDQCNNVTTCQADIILDDTEPPVVVCNIPNLVLECDQNYIAEINTWIGSVIASLNSSATDNCDLNLVAGHDWNGSSVPSVSCNGSTGLTITFSVRDDCNNITYCPALVTIDDSAPPIVPCNVVNLVLECDQNYTTEIQNWINTTMTNLLNVSIDACNLPLVANHNWNGALPTLDCSGGTGVTVNFTITDGCGNVTTCPGLISIDDSQPPIVNCVASNLVLQCDQDYLTEIQAWINTTMTNILNNSSDDCGQPLTISHNWDGSSVPTLDCSGSTGLPVVFTVRDACLNPTNCSALIIIDDVVPPTVGFPGDYGLPGCSVADITDLPFRLTETTITLAQFNGLGGTVTETCNSSFTITYQDAIIGTCPYRVRRTFRVTDQCLNQTTGNQIITITDLVNPVIVCPSNIIAEGCDTDDLTTISGLTFSTSLTVIDQIVFNNLDGPSQVSDNCGIREVTYIDVITQASCPLIIQRTFTATDTCGLTTQCSMTIQVQDTQLPTITCPGPVTGEGCSVLDINTHTTLPFSTTEQVITEAIFDGLDGLSEAADNCGILEVRYIDVITQATCPLRVNRTFTAVDSCGLIRTCVQQITIVDTQVPTIVCPADDIGEGCDVSAALAISGLAFSNVEVVITEAVFDALDGPSEASDLCGIREVRYIDVITQPSCPLIIERTFTAYDSCGLNTSCTQVITIQDTQLPTITCPAPVEGEGCNVSAILGISQLAYTTTDIIITEAVFEGLDGLSDAFDVCGIREITYVDSIVQASCPLIVSRRFTAFDSCGLERSCTQLITVRDLTPPVIVCPANITLEGCNEGDLTALTGLPFSTTESFIDELTYETLVIPGQASDNCGVREIGYQDVIVQASCPLIIERTYTVYDSCGLNVSCVWTITIQDTQLPTIVCPDPVTGEGCSVLDINTHTTLPFSTTEQVITEAIFDGLDGPSEAADNCGILEVRYIDVITQATCPLRVNRTFTAVDSCGLIRTCVQQITIVDTQVPTIVCPADDIGEGCDVSAALAISGLAFSNVEVVITEAVFDALDGPSEASDLCGIREVRYIDVITQTSCPLIIERTFTAYDSCGLNTSCTQVITIQDTQLPTITCPAPVEGEGCDVSAILGISQLAYTTTDIIITEAVFEGLDGLSDAFDVCGIREITYVDSIVQASCPLIVSRRFTAFDSCGLNTSCTQLITVRDLTPPVIVCPANITLEGCNEGDLTALTGLPFSTIESFIDELTYETLVIPGQASDNCGVREIGYRDVIVQASCPLIIERTYTVYDSCGLNVSCVWTITIQDTQLPTIVCPDPVTGEGCSVLDINTHTTLPFSTTEQVITEAIFDGLDGLSEAADNCGILEVRYIDVITQATCPLRVNRTFTAVDSCGLIRTCVQQITIVDTQVPTIICPADDIGEGCDVSAALAISGLAFSNVEVVITEAVFDALDGPSEASDLCGIREVRYIDVITQPSCPLIIERTFTAYDSCGLNTSCTQVITIQDTQLPTITCPAPVEGEGCNVSAILGISQLAYTTTDIIITEAVFEALDGLSDAFDVCGIREITYVDSIVQASCPLIVSRRFTAFDSCGLERSCTQLITVRDLTPPVIVCPANITLEGCNEGDLTALTGLPFSTIESFIDELTYETLVIPGQASDNCGVREIGYRDVIVQASCPLIIERTYTVYDSCGLNVSCVWTITIQDTQLPTIVCPDPVTGEGCSVLDINTHTTLPFSTTEQVITEAIFDGLDGLSEAGDLCGILEVRYIDVIFQASCPLIVDRTFTAVDSCGLLRSCTQRITIQDTQVPTIICPADDIGEGCDVSAALAISGLAFSNVEVVITEAVFDALDGPSEASDLCGIREVRYIDVITQPSCPLIIERTFTAYDSCGLNTSCTQEITIQDTQLPTITCPAPVEGEGCDVSAILGISQLAYTTTDIIITEAVFEALDGLSDAFDVCGIREITYVDSIVQASCPLIVSRRFTAFDSCGLNTSCTQLITVRDLTPPVIVCPANITLEGCNEGDLTALTGLPFSTTEIFIDELTYETLVIPGQASDNCGVREIGYRDVIVQASCPLIIERTYTVYDSCGLNVSCVWTITIQDTQLPTIVCPDPVTGEGCSVLDINTHTTLPFSTTEQVITEAIFDGLDGLSEAGDLCGILEVRYIDVIFQASCPLIVDRTFTAVDSCGLLRSCTQRITIVDTQVPTIICRADDIGEGCDVSAALAISGLAFSNVEVVITEAVFDALDGPSEASDLCGIREVRYIDVITQPSCPLIIERTFTAYDSCGLNTSCSQVITIQDTQLPTITCPAPVEGEGCDVSAILGISQLAYTTTDIIITEAVFEGLDGLSDAFDVCGIREITYLDSIVQASCPLIVSRRFTAFDSCGLNTSCTQLITVRDLTPPVIVCPANITLEGCNEGDLAALTGLPFSTIESFIDELTFETLVYPGQASDNCGVREIGYRDVVVNASCPLIIERTYTVYDSCGQSSFCVWTITIQDTQLPTIVCPDPVTGEGCSIAEVVNLTSLPFSISERIITESQFDNLDLPSEVSDACGVTEVRYIDQIIQTACPIIVDRIFTVFDSCGLNRSCTQRITIQDTQNPVITCPDDISAEGCDESALLTITGLAFSLADVVILESTFNNLDGASQVNDGCGVLEIRYHDVVVQASCPLIVDRIFVALDSCNLSSTCTQRITITDTQDPTLVCPSDVEGEGCDITGVLGISGLAYSPSLITIDATTFASLDGLSGTSDACGVRTIQYQDVISQAACPLIVLRTFTATDSCGLFSQCQQIITVRDTESPTITCPDDLTLEACSLADLITYTGLEFSALEQFIDKATFDALDGVSVTNDGCGIEQIGYRDEVLQASCPIRIRRTFTAYDSCGLNTSCVQLIQFNPITLTNPVCPTDQTTGSCLTQNEIDQLFATWISEFRYDGQGCNLQITRLDTLTAPSFCGGSRTVVFSVTDPCGNQTSCTSTFTVPSAPALVMSCPPNLRFQCIDDVPLPYNNAAQFESAGGSFTNTCGIDPGSFVLVSENSDGNSCPEVITRIYEIQDICGNTQRCTQIITINDTIAPILLGIPSNVTINCDGIIIPPVIGRDITAQDNCDQVLPVFDEQIIPGACESTYNILRTWTATDACGNSVQAQQNITVIYCFPDVTISLNPNPVCLDGSVTFNAVITNNFTNPVYRWQFLWNNTWIDLPGGNTIPFVKNNIRLSDAGSYRLLIADHISNLNDFDCNLVTPPVELRVNSPVRENISATICEGDSYVIGTSSYSETGNYTDTLVGRNSCDSIVNLSLTVLPNTTFSFDTTICQGNAIVVGGTTLNRAGRFVVSVNNDDGCDSTITVNITVQQPTFTTVRDTICEGGSVTIAGDVYTDGGNYTKILSDRFGCDSTLEISIFEIPTIRTNLDVSICTGDSYVYHGNTYNTSGSFDVTLTSLLTGCDSVVALRLQVLDIIRSTLDATICLGDSFLMAGQYYHTSGTYRDTLSSSGGCDSVITLNLTTVSDFVTELNISICEGESYTVGTTIYTQSGSYTNALTSSGGCDSTVNLTLMVNPHRDTTLSFDICEGESVLVGAQRFSTNGTHNVMLSTVDGCDSVITVNLLVHTSYDTTYLVEICQGESFILGGQIYSNSGNYRQDYVTSFGCDSIIYLELQVDDRYEQTLTRTICTGSSITIGTSTYSVTGNYTDSLTTINGCDSIIHLNLSVVDDILSEINVQICDGQSYQLGSTSYNTSGTYTASFISQAGCDSIVTLHLSVLTVLRDTTIADLCAGEIYDFDGTLLNMAGTYQKTYQSVAGCDSIQTLILTVLPVRRVTLNEQICEGETYVLNGSIFSQTGTYIDTLTGVNGCDSIVTLNLRVSTSRTTNLSRQICAGETFTFAGLALDSTGFFSDTLRTANGCDSIVNLQLTVHPVYNVSIAAQICEGQVYDFNNQLLSGAGVYTASLISQAGCDSLVNLTLNVVTILRDTTWAEICEGETFIFDGVNYNTSGSFNRNYTSSTGCDSIHTLVLAVLPVKRVTFNHEICEGEIFSLGTVNYDQPGVFQDTLTSSNGCDSIVTLNLRVNPAKLTNLSRRICQGDTFTFAGLSLDSSGIFMDTLQTTSGCDSVVILNLTVNPVYQLEVSAQICDGRTYGFNGQTYSTSGDYVASLRTLAGCDSIVTLHLSVVSVIRDTTEVSICEGEDYMFDGTRYSASGAYSKNYTSIAGCDSIHTLVLTVIAHERVSLHEEICQGEAFVMGGVAYNQTGRFVDTLPSAAGCDSVITLDLVVHPQISTLLQQSICEGDVFDFHGQSLDSTGTYLDTLLSQTGCDSIITLELTVFPVYNQSLTAQICEGRSYLFNGVSYTTAGTYTANLLSSQGCDSIVVLQLEVLNILRDTNRITICEGESYDFDGTSFDATGTYEKTYISMAGCDSIQTLLLIVTPTIRVTLNEEICEGESFTMGANPYTDTGIYVDTLSASTGCDSIVTLQLRTNPIFQTNLSDSLCFGSTYDFHGVLLDSSGIYQDTLLSASGCDSVVVLNLTVFPQYNHEVTAQICFGQSYLFDGQDLSANGVYTANLLSSNGCDSTVTLTLQVVDVLRTELTENLCEGDSVIFNGIVLREEGIYTDTLLSKSGCDSLITLNLNIIATIRQDLTIELCQGDSLIFGTAVLRDAGSYIDTLISTAGCDSIVSLTLAVNPTYQSSDTVEICFGSSYLFAGNNLTEPGTYLDSLNTVHGCDSVVVLQLIVLEQIETLIEKQLCSGSSISFDGQDLNTSGSYLATYTSVTGCDSLVTLQITVVDAITNSHEFAICPGDSVSLNDKVYHLAGNYTDTLTSVGGCDSILLITIIEQSEKFEFIDVQICEGEQYAFAGKMYTENTVVRDTFFSQTGCDSIVELRLEVLPVYDQEIEVTICSGTTHTFDGQIYAEAGTYDLTYTSKGGCDSIIHLIITVTDQILTELDIQSCVGTTYDFNGKSISSPGRYQDTLISSGGCDSIVVLDLRFVDVIETFEVTEICAGDSVLIQGIWFKQDILLSDTLLSITGCDSIAYHEVKVISNVTLEGVNVEICEGESVTLEVSLQGTAQGPISWIPVSGLSCTDCLNPIASPDKTTSYVVRTVGCLGTVIEDTITVVVVPLPKLELTHQVSPNGGTEVTLSAATIDPTDLINWYDQDGNLLCADCRQLLQIVEGEKTFTATASNSLGCEVQEEITVSTIQEEDECDYGKIIATNAMTPNGDGSNDYFTIVNEGDAQVTLVQIFSRWGELIYEGRETGQLWNGEVRGVPVNPGVYVYMIHGICVSGDTFVLTGNITVIR